MNNIGFITIKQAVQQLLAQSPHQHKLTEANIICAWKQIMPNVVLQRTEQISVKQHKLFAKISSAPLRQELQNNQDLILKRIQAITPGYSIAHIVFL